MDKFERRILRLKKNEEPTFLLSALLIMLGAHLVILGLFGNWPSIYSNFAKRAVLSIEVCSIEYIFQEGLIFLIIYASFECMEECLHLEDKVRNIGFASLWSLALILYEYNNDPLITPMCK